MTRAEALKVLEESFARPSSTPTLRPGSREAYLDEEKQRLRDAVIEPIKVMATASDFEWAKEEFGRNGEMHRMVAIAREEEKWLLYEPEKSRFAQAFELKGIPDPLYLLGFSSDDALAEWLG